MAVPGRISAGRAGQAESALLPDTKVVKRGLSMPAIPFSGCRRARLLGYNEGLTDLSKAPGLRSKCSRKAANRMQLCGHPWQWRRDHFRQKRSICPTAR